MCFKFFGQFELEFTKSNCIDFVDILPPRAKASPICGTKRNRNGKRFCGKSRPTEFCFEGHEFYVEFCTSDKITMKGFQMEFIDREFDLPSTLTGSETQVSTIPISSSSVTAATALPYSATTSKSSATTSGYSAMTPMSSATIARPAVTSSPTSTRMPTPAATSTATSSATTASSSTTTSLMATTTKSSEPTPQYTSTASVNYGTTAKSRLTTSLSTVTSSAYSARTPLTPTIAMSTTPASSTTKAPSTETTSVSAARTPTKPAITSEYLLSTPVSSATAQISSTTRSASWTATQDHLTLISTAPSPISLVMRTTHASTISLPVPTSPMTSLIIPSISVSPSGATSTPIVSSTTIECGTSINQRLKYSPFLARIIGGNRARPHSLPWTTSMMIGSPPNVQFCGASLIDNQFLLSAAHCYTQFNGNYSRITAKLGADNNLILEPAQQLRKISKIIIHPWYQWSNQYTHDIAIIKLDKPVTFNDYVRPICLPDGITDLPEGTKTIVAGWGVTSVRGYPSARLQQITVPIVTRNKCKDVYGGIIDSNMICGGYEEGGRDACQGDSGGPMVWFNKTRLRWQLEGVVSFGKGCAKPHFPSVYVQLSNFVSWITYTVHKNLT